MCVVRRIMFTFALRVVGRLYSVIVADPEQLHYYFFK